jgi:transcriptional regulator with XRE-family HTH domain
MKSEDKKKSGDKVVRATPSELEISERVKALMEKANMTSNELSKKIGHDNIYRVLSGERNWQFKYLERISHLFGVPLDELVGGPEQVAIVTSFSALEHFPYPEVIDETGKFIEVSGEGKDKMLQGMYALELSDRSMMPAFNIGTVFVAQKNSSESIEHENLVVCPDDSGKAQVGRVYFTNEHLITLKSLNPTVPDKNLPRNRIKSCDLVVRIIHQ